MTRNLLASHEALRAKLEAYVKELGAERLWVAELEARVAGLEAQAETVRAAALEEALLAVRSCYAEPRRDEQDDFWDEAVSACADEVRKLIRQEGKS